MIKLKNLLTEIGEGTASPFFTKDELELYEDEFGIQGSFETESGIMVEYEFSDELIFSKRPHEGYIFSFSVDGSTQQGMKTSMSEYLRIMATMVAVTQKFIEEYHPAYIKLTGDDKVGATGQKDRIYIAYLEKNKSFLNTVGYQMKQDSGELLLVKNTTKYDASGIDTPNDPTM